MLKPKRPLKNDLSRVTLTQKAIQASHGLNHSYSFIMSFMVYIYFVLCKSDLVKKIPVRSPLSHLGTDIYSRFLTAFKHTHMLINDGLLYRMWIEMFMISRNGHNCHVSSIQT